MKMLAITVLALIAVAASWRHRAAIDDWLAPTTARPKAIVFDNGTVREAAPAATRALASAMRSGSLRKCMRGQQTTYTNSDCPPGFHEKTVAADRVTVLEAQPTAATAAATPGSAGTGAQRRLHDALVLRADKQLRQRMMERAIESGSR